MHHTQQQVTLL